MCEYQYTRLRQSLKCISQDAGLRWPSSSKSKIHASDQNQIRGFVVPKAAWTVLSSSIRMLGLPYYPLIFQSIRGKVRYHFQPLLQERETKCRFPEHKCKEKVHEAELGWQHAVKPYSEAKSLCSCCYLLETPSPRIFNIRDPFLSSHLRSSPILCHSQKNPHSLLKKASVQPLNKGRSPPPAPQPLKLSPHSISPVAKPQMRPFRFHVHWNLSKIPRPAHLCLKTLCRLISKTKLKTQNPSSLR